jgi:hypothetical protein
VTTGWVGINVRASTSARFVVIAMVTAYFVVLLALGGHQAWAALGVPPVSPGFLDLRTVTSSWDCARQNLGAWPHNPCDPWDRPNNYPRIWMAASILGLGEDDTYLLGSLLAIAFFAAAILVLPRRAPLVDALVYGLALCSPAVMLGVERGNVDVGVFCLVVGAGFLVRRPQYGPAAASGLILLAAILKLFPIAAIGMFTGLARRAAALCVASVGAVYAVYVAATYRDLQTIERVTPQLDTYSYGLGIFSGWLGRMAGSARMWDAAIILLTIAVAIALRRRLADRLTGGGSREFDLFCAGAGIYVATFALVRSFDYRLVFLLLTIPQLVRWATAGRALAAATLCGIFVTLWLPNNWRWSNVPVLRVAISQWHELTVAGGKPLPIASPAQVVAFIGLACLLAATLQANWDRESGESEQRVTAGRQGSGNPANA